MTEATLPQGTHNH